MDVEHPLAGLVNQNDLRPSSSSSRSLQEQGNPISTQVRLRGIEEALEAEWDTQGAYHDRIQQLQTELVYLTALHDSGAFRQATVASPMVLTFATEFWRCVGGQAPAIYLFMHGGEEYCSKKDFMTTLPPDMQDNDPWYYFKSKTLKPQPLNHVLRDDPRTFTAETPNNGRQLYLPIRSMTRVLLTKFKDKQKQESSSFLRVHEHHATVNFALQKLQDTGLSQLSAPCLAEVAHALMRCRFESLLKHSGDSSGYTLVVHDAAEKRDVPLTRLNALFTAMDIKYILQTDGKTGAGIDARRLVLFRPAGPLELTGGERSMADYGVPSGAVIHLLPA